MFKVPEKYRDTKTFMKSDKSQGNNGSFIFTLPTTENETVLTIASDGDGWEHVSISLQNRCPTWDEMCLIKDMFWDEEDCVVQYHPPKSEHVNFHPHCLHLWRPIGQTLPVPASYLVGPKTKSPAF